MEWCRSVWRWDVWRCENEARARGRSMRSCERASYIARPFQSWDRGSHALRGTVHRRDPGISIASLGLTSLACCNACLRVLLPRTSIFRRCAPSSYFSCVEFVIGVLLWISQQENNSLSRTGLGYVVRRIRAALTVASRLWRPGAKWAYQPKDLALVSELVCRMTNTCWGHPQSTAN